MFSNIGIINIVTISNALIISVSLKIELVSKDSIDDLNYRLKNQKGIEVVFSEIKNANHFFKNKEEDLNKVISTYVEKSTELI